MAEKKVVKSKDEKFNQLYKNMLHLSKINAIVSSVYQYKSTANIINTKALNQENVIICGINNINPKVLTNVKKYESIINQKDNLLSNYINNLIDYGKDFDNTIATGNMKLFEEEIIQLNLYNQIFYLKKEESIARGKADNSDDEIAEKIYLLEDEVGKSEARARRTRTAVNNKIKEKESSLMSAMESEEKEIQTKIKGPQLFAGVKKFFFGKINPQKKIEQNVFAEFSYRIREFKEKEIKNLRTNYKYKEENLIESVDKILKNKLETNDLQNEQ